MLCKSFLTAVVCLLPLVGFADGLRVETVDSEALDAAALREKGIELKVNVLLPDGYADSDKRYPVVYLLHGYGGDYTEWQRVGVEEELKGVQAIIAMPEGDRSFYVNHHGAEKGRWEDYITQEVVGLVDKKYRTIASPRGRAISGLSMGGYGGIVLGLKHTELFGSCASHSGAVSILSNDLGGGIGDRLREIFGPDDSEVRKIYNPVALLDKLPKGKRPHIYLDCGSSDFLLEQNREFVRALAERGYEYEYREVRGAHNFAYWKRNVRYSVDEQLKALAAMPEPAAAEVDDSAIVGTWQASYKDPNGETRESEVTITKKDGKLASTIELRDTPREMSRTFFRKSRLEIELDVDRDGEKGVIRVEAKLDAGKLDGRWVVLAEDGSEFMSGAWKAQRKSKESPNARVVGTWNAESDDGNGGTFESVVHIKEKEGELHAVVEWDDGAEKRDLKITFEDSELVLVLDFERDGQQGAIRIDAKLVGGKLEGAWSLQDAEGVEFGTGEWKAEKDA